MTTASEKGSHTAIGATLPDSAIVLLAHAAQRTDGIVVPQSAPIRARGSALKKLLQRLLRLGLVAAITPEKPDQAWRTDEDGVRIGLRITAAGQAAIGIDEAHQAHESAGAAGGGDNTRARRVDGDEAADAPADDAAPKTGRSNRSGKTTRGRHGAGTKRHGGVASGKHGTQGGHLLARAQHRPGSKQALLVEHLSGPQGQSIIKLSQLLGWQAHTVRAAITGLRKKGYAITRDTNDHGTTVYRTNLPSQGGGAASTANADHEQPS